MNLKIQNVSLSIKGRIIVNDVSITVNPGEVVGLMGPNGAGKTTTFNLAVGNIKPDKGEVLLNDKKITKLPLPIRSRLGLGYLSQEASIFRDLTGRGKLVIFLPFIKTSPLSGFIFPTARLKVVVFPAPFGPIKPTISPGFTVIETSLTINLP